MIRKPLIVCAVLAILLAGAAADAATTGAMVGVDDGFWGTSIGQVDNSAQASDPLGIFAGSLDIATVNGWLAAGGVHSFALIPPGPGYGGNGSLPLAGVPNVGVQEMTLTLSDWSTVTVPLTNAAWIKRGITQGAPREFYYDDMNFNDHESGHVIPVNGGPRPVLYQVDLSAHQGQTLALDAQLDLRGNGWSEPNKVFDAYEVTEDYDYTTVTYGSLVYDGDIPELPPLNYVLGKSWDDSALGHANMHDALLVSGQDTPLGTEVQACVTGNNGTNAMVLDFDFEAAGITGVVAANDGVLEINVGWDRSNATPPDPPYGPPSQLGLYELIGDDGWDETTVTAVNYAPDGQVPNVLGDMVAELTVDPTKSGNDNSDREKGQQFTIPQATLTKLLKNEIAGLAISSIDTGVNCCIRTSDSSDFIWAKPRLIIEVTEDAGVPGDANGDGAVTDADYTIWADNYGASGATQAMGDFNGDGEVTDADYTIWADNYGAGTTGIPEPATLVLIASGGLAALRRRR